MKLRTLCFSPGRVTPGMTLAKAATNQDGQTLLAAGTELDAEMLDRLIRRGVETVSVLVPDTRDEETIADELHAAEARIDHIFRRRGSPAKDALRTAVLNFRLESVK
jgi:hypothetical protein